LYDKRIVVYVLLYKKTEKHLRERIYMYTTAGLQPILQRIYSNINSIIWRWVCELTIVFKTRCDKILYLPIRTHLLYSVHIYYTEYTDSKNNNKYFCPYDITCNTCEEQYWQQVAAVRYLARDRLTAAAGVSQYFGAETRKNDLTRCEFKYNIIYTYYMSLARR